MSSASGSAVKKVGPSEVVPAKNVIHALMETLVDPLWPFNVLFIYPQENVQKSVAKQMHAVVLLYNYHHRKQNSRLQFLNFVPFCKIVLELRRPLFPFMKATATNEPIDLNIADNQLSPTEKAIKDACDIALALDSSKDFPEIAEWTISEVAILLIDSKKENCTLRFGDVTQGVWSPITKDINEPRMNMKMLSEEKIGDKRKQNSFSTHVNGYLLLAYDAVKDITGISSRDDLWVLENHVTYSLKNKESAVCVYMMQCSQSFPVDEQVSLKFLAESLHGPLLEKIDDGWKTSPVVEYYHMIPYVELILSWLSGEGSSLPNSDGCMARIRTRGLGGLNKKGFGIRDKLSSGKQTDLVPFELKTKGGVAEKTNTDENGKTFTKSKGTNENDELVPEDDGNVEVNMVESVNKVIEKNKTADVTISINQNGISEKPDQPYRLETETRFFSGVENMLALEVLRNNALALLKMKKQETFSRLCSFEDALAFHENAIERIRDGGEAGFARECIKSILSDGDCSSMFEHRKQNQANSDSENRLSANYLPGKSSLQDLECICMMNNWKLRYLIEPSQGEFISEVFVKGKGLELHSKGGAESKPYEARESAAAQMIAQLKNL